METINPILLSRKRELWSVRGGPLACGLLLSIFGLTLLAATEQQSERDTLARRRPDNASLAGTVIALDTRESVASASVAIQTESGDRRYGAVTDAQGRFSLKRIRPGQYRVYATKVGYIAVSSQARPLDQGLLVDIQDDDELKVDLWFAKGARLSGQVMDDDGRFLAGASIQVLRRRWVDGNKKLIPVAQTRTDHRGEYEVRDLSPGDYYVRAHVNNHQRDEEARETPADPVGAKAAALEPTISVVPTYYPGTPYIAEAQSISLGLGQEFAGLSLVAVRAPAMKVSGYVLDSDGAPAAGTVALTPDSREEREQVGISYSSLLSADGRFNIPNVPLGHYILTARTTRDAAFAFSRKHVVIDQSLRELRLVTSPAASITGRVAFGSGPAPRDLGGIRIALVSLEASVGAPARSVVKSDGTFAIENIPPGPLLLKVSNLPRGWFLDSITMGGRDVADAQTELQIGEQVTDATIRISDSPGEVSGTIVDTNARARGRCAVMAFPTDRTRWVPTSHRIVAARSNEAGWFNLRGLPRGEYYLAALDKCDDGTQLEPDILGAYVSRAARIRIEDSSRLTVSVTMRP